jgi:hypothetical protein
VKLPFSVLDDFAQCAPNDHDVKVVMAAIEQLESNPNEGTPLRFNPLDDLLVIWTADKKWRIVFRRCEPDFYHWFARTQVVAIQPEPRFIKPK